MDDKKLSEIADRCRFPEDSDVLDLIVEYRFIRSRLESLSSRLKSRVESDAAARQSQLKSMAKCHG